MGLNQLFAKKSIETLLKEMKGENRLRRILGPVQMSALGIGAIIGAGIFVMTGRAAAQEAGPAIMVSYCVAGLGCAFAAFCYAEFASMVPVAGSAYTYSYATLGEIFAWIIGWDLILEYAMSCACVASSWSKYFNELLRTVFDRQVPLQIMNDPWTLHEKTGSYMGFNLLAVLIMLVVTTILVLGIRQSATTNAILVAIKLGVVLFVIIVGWSYINTANWTTIPVEERFKSAGKEDNWGLLGTLGVNKLFGPVDDNTRSPFMPFGFSGIMVGAAIVFFAYIGFDSISAHSEEAKIPQRDVPIGIIASLVICTILYLLVSAVITGMERYPDIDPDAAIAAAFRKRGEVEGSGLLRAAAGIIAFGALAGMTSVLLITFLSQARIFLAMSRDGFLPPRIFAAIHPRFRTPHISTMLTGAIICLVAAITPILRLEEMVNIGTLLAFVIVCASVIVLRIKRPDAYRPFRCPAVFVVGPLGIAVNLFMMLFLPIETWYRLFGWLAIGLVLYFGYGYANSVLGKRLRGEAVIQPD
jgi:basic amino acid/polyamine antiporter, APA family